MTTQLDSVSVPGTRILTQQVAVERPLTRLPDIGFVLAGPEERCVQDAAFCFTCECEGDGQHGWRLAQTRYELRQGVPWQREDLDGTCRQANGVAGVVEWLGGEWVWDFRATLPTHQHWWYARVSVWLTPRPSDRKLEGAF